MLMAVSKSSAQRNTPPVCTGSCQSKAWPWRSRSGHPPSMAGGCSHWEGDSTDLNFICLHKQHPAQNISNHLSRVRTSARDTPQLTHHCRADQPPAICLQQEKQGRGKDTECGAICIWQGGQLQQEHWGPAQNIPAQPTGQQVQPGGLQ